MVVEADTTSRDARGDGVNGTSLGDMNTPVERRDIWHYPSELNNDLKSAGLPQHVIDETLACAWEYVRCIIPTFTNWSRYISFVRIVVVGIG